jgi:phage lysis regulatory protein, LysB family
MLPVSSKLTVGLLLVSVVSVALLTSRIQTLNARNALVAEQRNQALAKAKTQQAIIGAMADHSMKTQAAQSQLRGQIATVAGLNYRHEQTIRTLEQANETLKIWSNTRLPDPVIRMRQRPAITGSAAYRDWLSERDTLSATPDPAAFEWRPATRR